MDPLLLPSDGPVRLPGLRGIGDPNHVPRLPRLGAGLERLGDGALAMLLAGLSARLAFAVELREARGWSGDPTVERALGLGIGFGLAVFLIGFWVLIVAPMLSLLSMRALRKRWDASRRLPVGRLAFLALASAAIPLAYVGAIELLATSAPQGLRDLAWVIVLLAALNPIIVFAATVTVLRDRVVRIVILLLALASLIHLANTLFG